MRTSTLLRAEEFARVAEVLGPCELVNGEIIPMSPGGLRHSEITARAHTPAIEAHRFIIRLPLSSGADGESSARIVGGIPPTIEAVKQAGGS